MLFTWSFIYSCIICLFIRFIIFVTCSYWYLFIYYFLIDLLICIHLIKRQLVWIIVELHILIIIYLFREEVSTIKSGWCSMSYHHLSVSFSLKPYSTNWKIMTSNLNEGMSESSDDVLLLVCCSIGLVKFANQPDMDQQFLLVGTARDYQLSPRHVECGYIYCYRWDMAGQGLDLGVPC